MARKFSSFWNRTQARRGKVPADVPDARVQRKETAWSDSASARERL